MQPALDKLQDHLIAKNVASDIAKKLCDSVAAKLEGKVLGTFESIAKTVKNTLTESLVQILSPKRRVDILRDCLEAKKKGSPYVMSFCGVSKKLLSFYCLILILFMVEVSRKNMLLICSHNIIITITYRSHSEKSHQPRNGRY